MNKKFLLCLLSIFSYSCTFQDTSTNLLDLNKSTISSMKKDINDDLFGVLGISSNSFNVSEKFKLLSINSIFSNIDLSKRVEGIEHKFGNMSGILLMSKKYSLHQPSKNHFYDIYFLPRTKSIFDPKDPYNLTLEFKDVKSFKVIKVGEYEYGFNSFPLSSKLLDNFSLDYKKVQDNYEFIINRKDLNLKPEEKFIDILDLKTANDNKK
ncbi:MAG: hypothetical protein U0354_18300 [Candidatus Sericytochromatia bacterium]